MSVLEEVQQERDRQDAKWGVQNHPDFPVGRYGIHAYDAERRARDYGVPEEEAAKWRCDQAARNKTLTFGHILVEEVAEVVGAKTKAQLREELIQTAAVCVAWVQKLDRETA